MTTNITTTSSTLGETVQVDGVTVKEDGKMVVQRIPTVGPSPTIAPGSHLYSSYFSSADLVAHCREIKPAFTVLCDSGDPNNAVWHGDNNLQMARYGSAVNGTVNLMMPHPFVDSAPNPGKAPPATSVGPGFTPGVSDSSALVPPVEGKDDRDFPAPGPGMDPKYGKKDHRDYFVHGPAVGVNSKGQPIDAEGRTAGPLPAAAGESEIGATMRLGGKVYDGARYDAWGNLTSGTAQLETLDPVYDDLAALKAAYAAADYQVAVTVTNDGKEVWKHEGFGPPDTYVVQPDGRVERTN